MSSIHIYLKLTITSPINIKLICRVKSLLNIDFTKKKIIYMK